MILFYYRDLRRRVERLEARRRAKPAAVYLEAVDEDGEPWNVAGPDADWFREGEDPEAAGGEPARKQAPASEGADQNPSSPEDERDRPPLGRERESPALDLPPFGHNQRASDRAPVSPERDGL